MVLISTQPECLYRCFRVSVEVSNVSVANNPDVFIHRQWTMKTLYMPDLAPPGVTYTEKMVDPFRDFGSLLGMSMWDFLIEFQYSHSDQPVMIPVGVAAPSGSLVGAMFDFARVSPTQVQATLLVAGGEVPVVGNAIKRECEAVARDEPIRHQCNYGNIIAIDRL